MAAKPLSLLTRLQWCGRILVACRVSVISALAGFLLFAFVPQARDLFDDITDGPLPYSLSAWGIWLLFFVYVFLIWAFPVHYAARSLLERTDDWMIPARLRYAVDEEPGCKSRVAAEIERLRGTDSEPGEIAGCIKWIPRVLGLTPFLAICFGLFKSYQVVADTQAALTPSAQAVTQLVALSLLDAVFAFAFIAFVVMRKDLVARVFGNGAWLATAAAIVSVLLVTSVFFFSYFAPFYQAILAPRALIVPFLFGSLVFAASALAWLGDRYGAPLLLLSIVAAFAVTALNTHFNDLRTLPNDPQKLSQRQIEIADAVRRWRAANRCDDRMGCPPALIVAAEGGASRAAFAAATALGDLLEREKELADHDRPPLSPGRHVFAISGVSGGAFGAATIRTALWEALERGGDAPPCKTAPAYWFRANEPDAQSLVARSWRACLQTLVSGDYLTPAFIGLGFRDNLSPPEYLLTGASLLKDDRAALVERAWEGYFDRVIAGEKARSFATAAAESSDAATGLRRPFGYLALELDRHEGAWLPLLLLNGTSVDKGTRIIASDLVSTRPDAGSMEIVSSCSKASRGRAPLYPAAFDLFEMLSKPCPPAAVECQGCNDAHKETADLPDTRNGDDVRLSTTAMLSARFPVVSPAGTIRAKGDDGEDGDRVVDGGYFENAGLTTALDVARALRDEGVTPIVLWVQNEPKTDKDARPDSDPERAQKLRRELNDATGRKPQFPPRAASAPRLLGAWPDYLQAFFAVVATPFDALYATRDGHALEAADLVQRRLEEMNKESCERNDPKRCASYFTFEMYKNPRFGGASKECQALAAARPQPIMSEVSMSWWLSQSVQAELDAQICEERNLKSLRDLMERLSQKLK